MAQHSILELAKQGNPNAIAALLNRSLATQEITAKAQLTEGCLHLLVESDQVPNQQAVVTLVGKGMIRLGVESIKTVKVYGRQFGKHPIVWHQTIELRVNAVSPPPLILPEQSPPLPLLEDCIAKQTKKAFPPLKNTDSPPPPIPSEPLPPLPPLEGCIAKQTKKAFPVASRATKQLADELLELVNYDQEIAEKLIGEIIAKNPSKSLEWYFEKAISNLLRNQT